MHFCLVFVAFLKPFFCRLEEKIKSLVFLKKNQTKTSAVKSTHACTSWLEEKPKRAL